MYRQLQFEEEQEKVQALHQVSRNLGLSILIVKETHLLNMKGVTSGKHSFSNPV